MTIQEYIRVAANGYPKDEFLYYRLYFTQMDCKWCFYKGYGCKHPKTEGVCIDYRVEKKDLEFKPVGEHERNV
jgi:hypothetical protein